MDRMLMLDKTFRLLVNTDIFEILLLKDGLNMFYNLGSPIYKRILPYGCPIVGWL